MFSERLKKVRKSKGLTLDTLAEIYNQKYDAGLNKGTLSKYENNKQEPMISVVSNLATILDVSVDYLLCKDSENNNNQINPLTNKKMTSKEKKQYNDYLEEASLFFNDENVSEEDKEFFMLSLNKIFWEAKKINKEKYAKSHNKTKNEE